MIANTSGISVFAQSPSSARSRGPTSGPDSDVDLLVDLDDEVSLFGMSRLKWHIEALLGRRVDLVDLEGLRPRYRNQIIAEAVRAA